MRKMDSLSAFTDTLFSPFSNTVGRDRTFVSDTVLLKQDSFA